MPVQTCQSDGKSGYRWGSRGKCYTYPAGNDRARREAKRKAIVQGIAAGERPTAALLNLDLEEALANAETAHLSTLTRAYRLSILQAGALASERFAFTAAADWQPPPEGAT